MASRTLPPVREGLPTPLSLRERLPTTSSPPGGLLTHPGPPGGPANSFSPFREGLPTPHVPPDSSRPSRRALRSLPALREVVASPPSTEIGLPTPWPSGRASLPLPALRVGLPSHSVLPGGPLSPPGGPPHPSSSPGETPDQFPSLWEDFPTPAGPPEGPPEPSQPSEKALRPLPTLQEGLPTPADALGGSPYFSRSPGRVSRPLSALQKGLSIRLAHRDGLQNSPGPPERSSDTYPPTRKNFCPREGCPTLISPPGGTPDPCRCYRRASQLL